MKAAFAVLLGLLFCSTASLADHKQKLTDVRSRIDREHQMLLDSEVKKRGILGTLYEINKNIHKINSDMESLESQLRNSKKSAESYAKTVIKLENILEEEKKLLKVRLRALYKMGLRGYTEVLLSSQTGEEFSRNMKFLKIIILHDNELIDNYRSHLTSLSRQQLKLREQVKMYALLQHDLTQQKVNYTAQKEKQIYLLNEIERNRESHYQALREFREAGRKLEEKLVQLGLESQVSTDMARGAFFEQKGILKAPVLGEIAQKYGIIKNDRFSTQIFHKGLFFNVEPGAQVTSVFWGKVAFAGWINGYGETIIVDHGDHYYTLYAHNAKLEKKSGEPVSSGEVIAEVGDTGSLRGPGLYMEIRHFSESLDPLPWLDLRKTSRL